MAVATEVRSTYIAEGTYILQARSVNHHQSRWRGHRLLLIFEFVVLEAIPTSTNEPVSVGQFVSYVIDFRADGPLHSDTQAYMNADTIFAALGVRAWDLETLPNVRGCWVMCRAIPRNTKFGHTFIQCVWEPVANQNIAEQAKHLDVGDAIGQIAEAFA